MSCYEHLGAAMHEYSIVRSILDRVESEARQRDASAVHRVRVRIGELAGVEIDLLRSAFEMWREESICAGAELDVVAVDAVWACPSCSAPIERGAVLRCPACARPARLTSGDEIVLDRIEMEVA